MRELSHCFPHSRNHIFGLGPGSAKEQRQQPPFSRDNTASVNHDVELTLATLFEFDREPQGFLDLGSVARRLRAGRASGVAVENPDVHTKEYSS